MPWEVEPPPLAPPAVLVRARATSVDTPERIAATGAPYLLRLRSGLREHRLQGRDRGMAACPHRSSATVSHHSSS